MPWRIVHSGNSWCVHKKNADDSTGEKLHCYDNKEAAVAYLRALYANVKESLVESSMYISKSSLQDDGIMRWTAVNSDVDWDLHGEKMSLEMYKSMLGKIQRHEPPPEGFKDLVCSEYWCGGMPYLSISHYPDFDGKAVPGEPTEMFIDGKQLKAKGILFDNEWGKEVWKSLKADENIPKDANRIRISIAFLDLAHRHGNGEIFHRKSMFHACPECLKGVGNKVYTDGYLVHLALTRVPVNPRTIMEVEKSMAKKRMTRKDDAASIVGEKAQELEEMAKLESKSDAMVEMSDVDEVIEESDVVEEKAGSRGGYLVADNGNGQPALPTEEDGKLSHKLMGAAWAALHEGYRGNKYEGAGKSQAISKLKKLYEREGMQTPSKSDVVDDVHEPTTETIVEEAKTKKTTEDMPMDEEEMDEEDCKDGKKMKKSLTVDDIPEIVKSVVSALKANEPEKQKSDIDTSVENLYTSIDNALKSEADVETKLSSINPALQDLGIAITTVVKNSVATAKSDTVIPDTDKIMLEQLKSLSDAVSNIATEVAMLKSQKSEPVENQQPRIPAPRSISPDLLKSLTAKSDVTAPKPGSVADIIRKQYGL